MSQGHLSIRTEQDAQCYPAFNTLVAEEERQSENSGVGEGAEAAGDGENREGEP